MMIRRYLLLLFVSVSVLMACSSKQSSSELSEVLESEKVHVAPDLDDIPKGAEGEMIRYGRELVMNTAKYIGPDGTNGKYLGNKMNCTNCHLDGGTRPYAYNFFSTYGNYPQYRSRENTVLTIEQRVNNCVERPHSGFPLPLDSKEMIAIVSYIQWVGKGVPIGEVVKGSERIALNFPNRPADPFKGKRIYEKHCVSCHGIDGLGTWLLDGSTYEYPPLWGEAAYQPGSSMFRMIKAAQFIKANMPFDKATWEKPFLSDEESFDVAAYINSPDHVRPTNKGGLDYKDVSTKYVDYPFGPYDDPFTEEQHKLGPFQPIIDYRRENNLYLNY